MSKSSFQQVLFFVPTGRSWQEKIQDVRERLATEGDDAIVITGLDEIAWLFNLRGKDIPYNPMFRSYAFVARDRIVMFLPKEKQTNEVMAHLNARVSQRIDNAKIFERKKSYAIRYYQMQIVSTKNYPVIEM
jgi:Xaa-Pro aminopeptidase